jgi:N4-(beta-N-acetylglucosaminyl)-L-asparaginase
MNEENAQSSSRRRFLRNGAAAAGAAVTLSPEILSAAPIRSASPPDSPVAIASGNGLEAAERAREVMRDGKGTMDGVIEGVNLLEGDPDEITVGYGGIPNADGDVQLDAAVMHGPTHMAGGVAALEGVKYPSKVARLVMERTDHVLIVGDGAQRFARMHGFEIQNLLTERARKRWLRWKENLSDRDDYLPPGSNTSSDEMGADLRKLERSYGTVHCAGLDADGNLSCVTTTSGLFFKIPNRVADSPIIGAGLYADNDVGAAGTTGRGEANLKNLSCFLIVERMRMGDAPEEACLFACRRIAENTHASRLLNDQGEPNFNVRFYAISKDGTVGGAEINGSGAKMAVADDEGARRIELAHLYDE